MKVRDITSVIEAYAPLSLQEDFDNSGLKMPGKKVVVNLAPADVRKEGSSLDLTIRCCSTPCVGSSEPMPRNVS